MIDNKFPKMRGMVGKKEKEDIALGAPYTPPLTSSESSAPYNQGPMIGQKDIMSAMSATPTPAPSTSNNTDQTKQAIEALLKMKMMDSSNPTLGPSPAPVGNGGVPGMNITPEMMMRLEALKKSQSGM